MNMKDRFPFSALAAALFVAFPASADSFSNPDFSPSQGDFGGVGLMQMPTGRVADEGQFTLGATLNEDYYHYYSSLQLMPWLEATVRYTRVPSVKYSNDPDYSGDAMTTDKGIDAKVRLWEEGYWLPETSIGLRDIGGTGMFDGEYIASTKRFGPVDLTLGVAWGYMGNSGNLLGDKSLSGDDCGRNTGTKGKGGIVDLDRMFTGCAALFGGVEYQTPWAPLRLKAEYDGNDYVSDRADLAKQPQSHFNFGAVYGLGDWGNISASYERGNTWTFGFNLQTNFNTLNQSWLDSPKPTFAPSHDETDWDKLASDLEAIAGYKDARVYANDEEIVVEGEQSKYRDASIAHDRAAAILANTNEPASTYRLIDKKNGVAVTESRINAEDYKRVANQAYIGAEPDDAISHQEDPRNIDAPLMADNSSSFIWGISPTLQQSLGGAEDFYLFNIGVSADAAYWLSDNIEFGGSVYLNLYDNYDKFTHTVAPGDSTSLKRVRTLVRQYISDNPVRMNNLQMTHFGHIFDDLYTQAYAGYLEMMYAGVGSELLYRPINSNWAIGLDVNYVAQRDPNSQFGIFTEENYYDPIDKRNYKVQTGTVTGHLSVYYRPEWQWFDDLMIKGSAGRYLAEDVGVTLDVSKQFDSGVIAGAFVTKTNLSADEFGEGSFNKGFYISVPFDAFTVKPSANRALIEWVPLTRDGGQMLATKYSLYDMTNGRYPRSEFTNR